MHVRFDRFELDVGRRALLAGGEPVHLPPKAFKLLEILVANSPRALTKLELTDAIWPETIVEESNLANLVADLRTALGDRGLVRTVHGFGYAFGCEVTRAKPLERVAALIFEGKEIPLYRGENVLGRDPGSGILIDHATVSRRHACVTIDDESAALEDLGSKNGTFIEETKITGRTPLSDGATFDYAIGLTGQTRVSVLHRQSL